jgi:hypothetical protein
MPQCQFPVFCCFCVSEKLHRKYSRNWTKKGEPPIFTEASRRPKMRWRGATGQAHPKVARPATGLHHQGVRPPGPPPDVALPPIYSPRREKPKPQSIFLETYCKPLPSSTGDREDPGALPGTLPERGILREAFYTTMVASGVMCE